MRNCDDNKSTNTILGKIWFGDTWGWLSVGPCLENELVHSFGPIENELTSHPYGG